MHIHDFNSFPHGGNLSKSACRGINPPNPLSAEIYASDDRFYLLETCRFVQRKELKMANRTRKNTIILDLSDDEKYILDTKYKLSGMRSRMAFLRHLIVYGYVYEVDYKELQEYNTNLARIGNSLNQIAKRLNATGHVYDEDVKNIKELMEQVWHTQKSMLSKQPYIKQ